MIKQVLYKCCDNDPCITCHEVEGYKIECKICGFSVTAGEALRNGVSVEKQLSKIWNSKCKSEWRDLFLK